MDHSGGPSSRGQFMASSCHRPQFVIYQVRFYINILLQDIGNVLGKALHLINEAFTSVYQS